MKLKFIGKIMDRWKTGNGIGGKSGSGTGNVMDRWKIGNGIESMHDGKAESQAVEQVM
jgi:hypothetical protein